MKYGQREVIDLSIYDVHGKKVVTLDSLKNSKLILDNHPYLFIKDALLNDDFLRFIAEEETEELTDYENDLGKGSARSTYAFGGKKDIKCKLIGKTLFRQVDDNTDKIVIFEIPNATLEHNLKFESSPNEVSMFRYYFKIDKFNDKGDFIKLHIGH